ncbi:MAG: YihY family inner membrane protein [Elusimicrobia bacterium]|nr:YihY family inner membrane protein [Elusimicrobiota bacterium]
MEQKILSAPRDLLFGRDKPLWWFPPPVVRWARFVYLVGSEFGRNRCPEKAAALGFETVLSCVPALVLSLFFMRSVGGLENISRDLPRHLLHHLNIDEISLTIPAAEAGADLHIKLSDKISEIVEGADRSLRSSSVSFTSLLGLILAAILLTLTLEHSLNDIWSSHGRRALLLRVALAWSMLTLGPLLIGASLYLTHGLAAASVGLAEFVLRMLGPLAVLFILYRLVPAAPVSNEGALLGASVSAAAWVCARLGFGFYLHYAVSIDKIYGAVGLLPIFLIWVWVAWMIVLTGAEVAYTFENLTRLTAIERRRRLTPFVQPGLMALGLVLRAAHSFRSGQGPVTGAELAEAGGLPDRLWTRLVALLLEKRILVEAGRDGQGFTLGRPMEALRVEDIFSAVEDTLMAHPEDSWAMEPNPLKGLSQQLSEARRRELGGKTISQLLDGNSA